MDAELVYKGLAKFAHKRKTWLLVLTGFGLTSYGCYKVYHLPYLTRKRARLGKVLDAFASIVDAISDSADMTGVVSKELKDFVQSDSDEMPNSLNQISKITKSQEFCESVARVTAALTAGISRGNCPAEIEENSGVCDRVMDKLLSTAGSGFASVVVGSLARNLIMAFFSSDEKPQERLFVSTESNAFEEGSVAKWFNIVCSDKGKMVTGNCIQVFVTTAVAVYLDKTMHINIYDDFFAGLTNPKHEKRVRDLLVSVCNNAIDTVLKTSHQVLTTNPSLAPCGMDTVGLTSSTPVMNSGASISSPDENEEYKQGEKLSDEVNERKLSHHGNNVSWASSISSALS